jgi:hypothetical protein
MSRSDIEEEKRVPFYLHVDEVQNYSNAAIEDVLSELRKYKLFLTAAHQYMFQLDRSIQEAILANAATLISFRVGATDAPVLSKHFGVQNNQLQDLHNFQAYVRPLEDGQPVDPVLLDLLPPPLSLHNESAALVRNSSVRFGRNKAEVEAKIASFVSSIGARLPRQAANKIKGAPKIRAKKRPPKA